MQTNSLIESGRSEITPFFSPHGSSVAALWPSHLVASLHAALLRWWRRLCGLGRGALRVMCLGVVLVMAIADAAIVRLTTNPTATALARSRTAWFHRWSVVACWVLGLQIERHGFTPVSGLVVVDDLSLIDALLIASVAPFVFVVDMDVRQRPIIGWVARLAGALFRDRRRRSDLVRINFMIERALKRRQLVVVFRTCNWLRGPALNGFPSALLQPAVKAQCSLTATVVRNKHADSRNTAARLLMQPLSRVAIAFQPPAYHHGDRKQLAAQIWREVQALENPELVAALRSSGSGTSADRSLFHCPTSSLQPCNSHPLYVSRDLVRF
ncbi:MAG: 1-acyl-sn-glycerol-3-phosphate acyltransferase [Chthoniobacteraceae bacterium]